MSHSGRMDRGAGPAPRAGPRPGLLILCPCLGLQAAPWIGPAWGEDKGRSTTAEPGVCPAPKHQGPPSTRPGSLVTSEPLQAPEETTPPLCKNKT